MKHLNIRYIEMLTETGAVGRTHRIQFLLLTWQKLPFLKYWKSFCWWWNGISHSEHISSSKIGCKGTSETKGMNTSLLRGRGKNILPSSPQVLASQCGRAQKRGRDWERFSTAVLKRLIVWVPCDSFPSSLKRKERRRQSKRIRWKLEKTRKEKGMERKREVGCF